MNAAGLFLSHVGREPTLLMVLLGLIALGDKVSRWVIGLIVVPWALLWAALASYDLRNLALAVPFVAMSVGTGAAAVMRAITVSPVHAVKSGLRRVAAIRTWVVVTQAAALIAAGIGLSLAPTSERLIAHHRRMERELGNAALNARQYAQYDRQPFSRLILSNYGFLFHLPDLEDFGVFQNLMGSTPESIEFAEYRKHLEDPRIGYILLSIDSYPSIMRDVGERLEHGDFKLLFRAEGYLFVEIIRR